MPAPGGRRAALLAAALVAGCAALLRLLPHVWGYRFDAPHRVFLGIGYLPGDFRQYAALAAQARDGAGALLANEFTTQPHDPRLLALFASLTGWTTRLVGGSVEAVVWASHALQLLAILAFFALAWRLSGRFFPDDGARLRALVLLAFSGGLEWLLWSLGGVLPAATAGPLVGLTWPVRSWNTFEGLFAPHQVAGYASLLLLWNLYLDGVEHRRAAPLVGAALCVPLVYAFHGYTAFFLAATLGTAFAFALLAAPDGRAPARWERWGLGALLAAFALPLGLNLWQRQDPVYAAVLANAIAHDLPAPLWIWPLTFGALLPLAALGVAPLRRLGGTGPRLLAAAALAAAVLSTLPFLSASRFPLYLHLPLAVAAAAGLERLRHASRTTPRRVGLAALWAALLATNGFVVAYSLAEVRNDPNYYLTPDELSAARSLRELPPGGVLAGAASSTYLPWLARKRAYLGHWFLTPEMAAKTEAMRAFFAGGDAEERIRFLRRQGIRYLFVGPRERSLGRLDGLPLRRVVQAGTVEVYEVLDANGAAGDRGAP